MKKLCFTVDVDRDVNECVRGRADAVSKGSDTARFTSSEKGTNILLAMLDSMGIKATFFAEATTLDNIDVSLGKNEVAMHGLDHEDMTGEVSGIRLTDEGLIRIFEESHTIIKDRTGKAPKGFRAPYMRTDERITAMLPSFGILYDSSLYAPVGRTMHPYAVNGITEVPVPSGTDAAGNRMTAYLWPMHEGKRTPDDYIRMASAVEEGVFVIATHSWHMAETRSGGIMDAAEIKKNCDNVSRIITALLDSGFKATRITDCI